jgi:pimeloyl-ACP methyl ester carboxylesterase
MSILLAVFFIYILILFGTVILSVRPVRTPLFFSPQSIGINQFDVEFESENGRLRGWWLPHLFPKAVIVFAHGYLMNRSEWAALASTAHRAGYSCLLFDFHGHGKSASGGIVTVGPKEALDVAAAVEFARARQPRMPVAIVGSSMGAAATVLAATEQGVEADVLVLDSCYSNLASAVLGWWNFIGGKPLMYLLSPAVLVAWLVTRVNPFQIDITRALEDVATPVLVVHGEHDRLASPAHARRNFEALSSDHDSQIAIFHGANHGEAKWVNSDAYEKLVIEFLDAIVLQ